MRYLELVLLSGEDEEPAESGPGERIQVMTIHQSKGLEFEAVFVPSLVEGRLPQFGRSPRFELPPSVLEPLVRGKEDVIAEERRLLYVAMTRARRRLYLTHATHYEGGRRWRDSRFLEEVRSAGARAIRVAACGHQVECTQADIRSRWIFGNDSRTANADAVAHRRGGLEPLVWGDEIQGAELVC